MPVSERMTREEVDGALARAGITVPEAEKAEIAAATHFSAEMARCVRRQREVAAEPAHIFVIPEA